jgi:putative ABC transport system permease protein
VIGVVDDFHYASLHEQIEPAMIVMWPDLMSTLFVRIGTDDIPGVLAHIEDTWHRFAPERPVEYSFLDESYDALYRTEQRLGTIVGVFASLAILIACLGLFGLVLYTTQRRTKEIGIRKVFGANSAAIAGLITKDFARLVVVAFLVAVPVAYLIMQRWLEDFAYHVTLGADLFLVAGLVVFVLASLTAGFVAYQAAATDPVHALRYE